MRSIIERLHALISLHNLQDFLFTVNLIETQISG